MPSRRKGGSQQLPESWNRYCNLLHAEHGGREVAAVVQRSAPPGREFVLALPEAVRTGVQVFIVWACPHEAGSVQTRCQHGGASGLSARLSEIAH
ncbi:MAG: hypothetical protein Q4A98_10000 [Comamonadaceae bacterium]|nr:hypothetical protein [Comamonadaceae bacterium]